MAEFYSRPRQPLIIGAGVFGLYNINSLVRGAFVMDHDGWHAIMDIDELSSASFDGDRFTMQVESVLVGESYVSDEAVALSSTVRGGRRPLLDVYSELGIADAVFDPELHSEEGGRFRAPIEKFGETLTATIGLLNFARFYEAFE